MRSGFTTRPDNRGPGSIQMHHFRRLDALLPQVRKARCLGALAAELAYIAAGFLDGLVYEGIKLWDFAAGKILVEEAGGFLEAAETEPDQWRVLAGAPRLRETLKTKGLFFGNSRTVKYF